MTAKNVGRRRLPGAAPQNLNNSSNANCTENFDIPQSTRLGTSLPRPCLWCGREFVARQTGGSAQSFCCAAHRHKFGTASRRYVAREIAAGHLTIEALKAAQTSAHAVLAAIEDAAIRERDVLA